MKHLSSIVLAVALIAAGATACFKDPASSLRNGPSRIELTRSSMFLNVGDSLSVQAVVKDAQGNTYDCGDATWTSSDSAVAAVRKDTTVVIPFNAYSTAFVRAVAPGLSWVTVTTHGLTDSIQVYGLPLSFDGTVTSVANPTTWDTITVNSSAGLTFSTGTTPSVVTFDGVAGYLVSRTANQIKIVPPPAAAGKVTITNVVLAGVVQIASLNSPTVKIVTKKNPGNGVIGGATPFTLPTTATAGSPYRVFGWFTGAVVEEYFTFTTTAPAAIHASLNWFGDGKGTTTADPDLDVIVCAATHPTCDYNVDSFDVFGFAAAGSSQPEVGTSATLPAGTYIVHTYGYSVPTAGMQYHIALNLQ